MYYFTITEHQTGERICTGPCLDWELKRTSYGTVEVNIRGVQDIYKDDTKSPYRHCGASYPSKSAKDQIVVPTKNSWCCWEKS